MGLKCPVCRQTVMTDAGGRNIDRHRDGVGKPCPATGLPERACREDW